MKFRHLVIFKSVCEEMNMTKAAKKLFMTQPSVSQAIRELEDHYQTRLFERLSRKLHLTHSGQLLLSYADHIIALNGELEEVMASENESQKINIGATVTIGTYCLPKWIAEFCMKDQGHEIVSSIKNTEDIERSLLNSTIDLGLVEGHIDAEDIVVKPFMSDELIVICSPDHEFSKSSVLEDKDLCNQCFLIREEGSGSRRMFLENIEARDIKIHIVGEYNNNEAIKIGVMNGLGLGVVSKASIRGQEGFVPLEIKGMKMTRQFSLIYHQNKYLNKSIESFITFIFDELS